MSISEFFWTIATDCVPLMIPLLSIGIAFYLIYELIYTSTRGR